MNKRKRDALTLIIIGLIIIGGSLATLITIRDFDSILEDFAIPSNPFYPDGKNDTENDLKEKIGRLMLYYSSLVDTSTMEKLFNSIISSTQSFDNFSNDIEHLWITFTYIRLVGRDVDNSTIVENKLTLDLITASEQEQLLTSIELPAGNYSMLKLHYESTAIVQIDGVNSTFGIQGSNFAVITFTDKQGKEQDLEIETDQSKKAEMICIYNIIWMIEQLTLTIVAKV